jgi:hypothetical protein
MRELCITRGPAHRHAYCALQAARRLRKGKQLRRQASGAFVCAVVWEVWVTFVRYC